MVCWSCDRNLILFLCESSVCKITLKAKGVQVENSSNCIKLKTHWNGSKVGLIFLFKFSLKLALWSRNCDKQMEIFLGVILLLACFVCAWSFQPFYEIRQNRTRTYKNIARARGELKTSPPCKLTTLRSACCSGQLWNLELLQWKNFLMDMYYQ